jgi:hypothetical protein
VQQEARIRLYTCNLKLNLTINLLKFYIQNKVVNDNEILDSREILLGIYGKV